jgi:cation/acetate symporter
VDALSLGLGLSLGLLGLPHMLMRFFTVADARAARRSVGWATGLIGCFPAEHHHRLWCAAAGGTGWPLSRCAGKLLGGGNMAALHLASLLGGPWLQALIAGVAFATILAVVAWPWPVPVPSATTCMPCGCATASPIRAVNGSCPGYPCCCWGAGRTAVHTVPEPEHCLSGGAGVCHCRFQQFPVLLLALNWRGLSPRGALAGGYGGMLAALLFIITGPTVWVGMLGQHSALFPYANPACFRFRWPLLLPGWLARAAAANTIDAPASGADTEPAVRSTSQQDTTT